MMNKKSGRCSRNIKASTVTCAFAVSALILGAVASVAPARAATLTYDISFSVSGGYSCCVYDNSSASGSFDITFDPTLAASVGDPYVDKNIAGYITNLTYTVTDPKLGGNITSTLNPITAFTLQYGELLLYSNVSDLSKAFTNSDLLIEINGVPPPVSGAGVWYTGADMFTAQIQGGAGSVTIQEDPITTPLPAALPLLATGLGGLGLLGWRRKRKVQAAARIKRGSQQGAFPIGSV